MQPEVSWLKVVNLVFSKSHWITLSWPLTAASWISVAPILILKIYFKFEFVWSLDLEELLSIWEMEKRSSRKSEIRLFQFGYFLQRNEDSFIKLRKIF